MGIKNIIKKAAGKAGDTVSKVSSLSPEQLLNIQNQREKYLSEMPNPNDPTAIELTNRLLAAGSVEIYNAYLSQIKDLYAPIENGIEYDTPFMPNHNIRFINITKWVKDKTENSLEKLVNVYEVLSNEECNIALVFNRKMEKTNIYLAVTNTKNAHNNVDINSYINRIKDAIKGNFPGSEWNKEIGVGILPCLKDNEEFSIATATNIPTEKSDKFISQTIEKLLDGIVPDDINKEYTIILLATPVKDIESRKLKLGELYSGLAPYSTWETNFTYNESNSTGSSATVGVNVGASAGVQSGQNSSSTNTQGITDSTSKGISDSTSDTTSDSTTHTDTKGTSDTVGVFGSVGGKVGIPLVAEGQASVGGSYSHGWSKSASDTITKGTSKTVGQAISKTLGKAVSNSLASTTGVFKSINFGGNFGMNFSRSSNITATIGKNEGITQTYTNYNIKHTLDKLEKQMERLEQSSALGLWDFAAYVLSSDQDVANNVAHSYLALTQGNESHMSESAINLWRGDRGDDSDDAKEIFEYLKQLRHPLFGLNPSIISLDSEFLVYPSVVTATTSLTGKELAYSLNFPQKSISGLPVIECAEFGRNITTYESLVEDENHFDLGNIFHMNHEENISVALDVNSLSSHTFITGSTGSGKSNTVYQLLNEANKKNIKFLVIEPAKGEYKHVFGNRDDVCVYGTNPQSMPLLKINPFRFPKGIHVLEHIDRLIEIFNVCWPMYAAMPAVLKNAVELSYIDCGWNLTLSTNEFDENLYPTFQDVCRNIKSIIDSSEYDNENKGAYKGALLTRLTSLTTGIYGLMFTKDEISCEQLFTNNTIIDLSRVGSTETKSLLMGLLVLKLQEYKTSDFSGMNKELNHITVLEEAHNLLKRTSYEQTAESSNLMGKSVEMISNAIAEMRTYGEGFIIVDQSPGLLDMSAIRNTNTKVIMRLPDYSDRELVGRAAGLNDNQIAELSKLPKGVAAVYQNEWIEPILCKIKKAEVNEDIFIYDYEENNYIEYNDDKITYIATLLSKCNQINDENKLNDIKSILFDLPINDYGKVNILKWIVNPPREPRMTKLAPIMTTLFPEVYNTIKRVYNETSEPKEWTKSVNDELNKCINTQIDLQVRRDIIQCIMTEYILLELNNGNALEKWSKEGGLREFR